MPSNSPLRVVILCMCRLPLLLQQQHLSSLFPRQSKQSRTVSIRWDVLNSGYTAAPHNQRISGRQLSDSETGDRPKHLFKAVNHHRGVPLGAGLGVAPHLTIAILNFRVLAHFWMTARLDNSSWGAGTTHAGGPGVHCQRCRTGSHIAPCIDSRVRRAANTPTAGEAGA